MSFKAMTVRIATLVLFSATSFSAFADAKPQTVTMTVTDKGFQPASVKVRKGQPVVLAITRKTDKTCATEIVIDEHQVHTKLPLNKEVKVTFTPKKSGELKYGCGMNKMIGGVLVVE